MGEKMSEVYEAYDIEDYVAVRGRGAIILKNKDGLFQLKIPECNESRIIAEYEFKEKLCDAGFDKVDRCIKNKDGALVTFDRYGNPYVMRKYYEGKECSVTSEKEIEMAVTNLALMHKACEKVFMETEADVHVRVDCDFRRRNRELKRVYGFMQKKKRKNAFEETYKSAYSYFYDQAVECERRFGRMNMENAKRYLGYCHGSYDYHSIIIYEEGEDTRVATINFDRFYVGNQLADLYHFLRKVVEKNGYSFKLAQNIIEKYSELNSLSADDVEYIYVLYSYPEKFYKISNQYMNSSKNHISPKMSEKLEAVIRDEDMKQVLLDKLKSYKNQLKSI